MLTSLQRKELHTKADEHESQALIPGLVCEDDANPESALVKHYYFLSLSHLLVS